MTNQEKHFLYSQESNWERWPEREYQLLTEAEYQGLPDEFSSLWSCQILTANQIKAKLEPLAQNGNWTAEKVLSQI